MKLAEYKFKTSYLSLIGLLLFLAVDQANAQIKDWNTGSGQWSNSGNWSPSAVPQLGDLVRIGSIPGVQNGFVTLDVDQGLFGLQLTDGMKLNTETSLLAISGETLVAGMNGPPNRSSLFVDGAGGDGYDYITNQLSIENGGAVDLRLGARLAVNDMLYVDQLSLLAAGVGQPSIVDLSANGDTAMSLDGTILTSNTIVINQLGAGLVDLDGVGSGTIDISNGFTSTPGTFAIHGTNLTDPFSGSINMKSESVLFMNLSNGWTADGNISVTSYTSDEFARIAGGDLELTGSLNVSSESEHAARLQVEAETTYQPSAQIEIGIGDELRQTGAATINGGAFDLAEDGQLSFFGPTSIHGGSFNTLSNDMNDGSVDFAGATDWAGDATINGVAIQNGAATVSGFSTISAGVFDMDGATGDTEWNVNHTLNVNATTISSTGNNMFSGILGVGVSAFSRFSINLKSEDSIWTMAGELNISNSLPFPQTRVGGSRMRITGEMNADGEGIRILSDTDFADGSTTTFATPDTSLVMQGSTIVESGGLFMNQGTIVNGGDGKIQLNAGASLNELSLLNHGVLEVGDTTGIADVAEFESTSNARWAVEIGGHVVGDEFDLLLVGNGNAVLNGTLTVKLIDAGNGLFEPQIGDEFTILSAIGDVEGQFENAPISIAKGNGYQWEVLYNPHDVTLRLSGIIPNVFLGDVNEDGNVNLLDVAPFVEVLTSETYNVRADINCDGVVDLLDVSLFVVLLAN